MPCTPQDKMAAPAVTAREHAGRKTGAPIMLGYGWSRLGVDPVGVDGQAAGIDWSSGSFQVWATSAGVRSAKSWLLRWEYFRERPRPDYEYPLAHVHANAEFVDPGPAAAHLDKPPSHLHIPTARVPLVLVLCHVIAEWASLPKTDDWRELLSESLKGFERRRRAPWSSRRSDTGQRVGVR